MKAILIELILIVVAAIAAILFIGHVFTPFKANQQLLSATNLRLNATLNAELERTENYDGSYLVSFLNTNAGSNVIEVYVDGTMWNGKANDSGSNITVDMSKNYMQSVSVSATSGKTVYTFTSSSAS